MVVWVAFLISFWAGQCRPCDMMGTDIGHNPYGMTTT